MKDTEVAIVVVALAGMAFLMSKKGSDEPGENSRDFYDAPAASFRMRPTVNPDITEIHPPQHPKDSYAAIEQLESMLHSKDGYIEYAKSLDYAVADVRRHVEGGVPDPVREGLRQHCNELLQQARKLRSDFLRNIKSLRDSTGRTDTAYDHYPFLLKRDIEILGGILSENHNRWKG